MPILATDLTFFASERPVDNLSANPTVGGGGQRGATVVQDGITNNVFPDVMAGDRTAGRVQARLVYPAVVSVNRDLASNAHVAILTRPTDPNIEVCAFSARDMTAFAAAERLLAYRAVDWLQRPTFGPHVSTIAAGFNAVFDPALPNRLYWTPTATFQVGDLIYDIQVGGESISSPVRSSASFRVITATGTGSVGALPTMTYYDFDGAPLTNLASPVGGGFFRMATVTTSRRVAALALSTGATLVGATSIPVDRLYVRVVPPGANAGNASAIGLATGEYLAAESGRIPAFLEGSVVLIQHATTATTWELATVSRVDWRGTLNFLTPLANAYPVGSKVCAVVQVGALQGSVSLPPFSQQQWSRVWADVAVGPTIGPRYSQSIDVTNESAIDDRWAIVFKTTTTFDLISERFGQIAAGSIATNFLPLNPATSQPFFTMDASGWGTGWLPGNVVRFNTQAASAPVWMARCVSPGAAAGSGNFAGAIRVDVDA